MLLLAMPFVVLEDESFLFTDPKDKNNQFKLINEEGKLIKAWGKFGLGPDEFGGLFTIDYQPPYLAVLDASKQRAHIFIKLGHYEFKKIGEILTWEAQGQLKIYKKKYFILWLYC